MSKHAAASGINLSAIRITRNVNGVEVNRADMMLSLTASGTVEPLMKRGTNNTKFRPILCSAKRI
jgi:hypothetical protein